MKLLNKIILLTLCLALLVSLWGCGGRELYERLLIHGVGIDVKGDSFTVTVRSSISPEDEGEEFFRCEGSTVLEALNELTLSTGRKPFYAQNYLVVFGSECAERGLDRCLDFFVRYYNTRPAVQLYLAEGRAEDILGAEADEKYLKMSEIQQLGNSARDSGKAVSVELLDFVNGVKREGSSPVMPVLHAGEGGVEIVSTAYFDGYRLKGFLTLTETRGYLAATAGLPGGEAVVTGADLGSVTLSLHGGRQEITVSCGSDGLPRFLIHAEAAGDVSAVSGCGDRLGSDFYSRVEEELSRLLTEEIEAALRKAVTDSRCDIFGFGSLLYRQEPDYWRQNAENWKDLMARCHFEICVSATVRRMEQERGVTL